MKCFNNLKAPKIDTPEGTREDPKELQLTERSCPYSVQQHSPPPPPPYLCLWRVTEKRPPTVKSRPDLISLPQDKLHLPLPKGRESSPFVPMLKRLKTPGLCSSRTLCLDFCITVTKHRTGVIYRGAIFFVLVSKALSLMARIAALSMMAVVA